MFLPVLALGFHTELLAYLQRPGEARRGVAERSFALAAPRGLAARELGAWLDFLRMPCPDLAATFAELETKGRVRFRDLAAEMRHRLRGHLFTDLEKTELFHERGPGGRGTRVGRSGPITEDFMDWWGGESPLLDWRGEPVRPPRRALRPPPPIGTRGCLLADDPEDTGVCKPERFQDDDGWTCQPSQGCRLRERCCRALLQPDDE